MENKEKVNNETLSCIPIEKWRIDYNLCDGCGECIEACDRHLLKMVDRKVMNTSEIDCPQCGDCRRACGPRAISLT